MPVIPYDGFIGGAYRGIAPVSDGERCIELYPENIESQHGKAGATSCLIGRPGVKTFGPPLTDTVVRCLYAGDNRLFCVSGGTLYEVFDQTLQNPQAPNTIGTVQNSTSPAQIALNGGQLFVASGGQGYVATNETTLIPVVAASSCTFMDSYFIAPIPNTNQFQISANNDGTSWNPLDVGVKEGYSDAIANIVAAFEQLWIFGFDTTEVWYDSGAANFPFQRIPSALLMYGCYAPWSVAVMENSIMWLGGASFSGHGVVYQSQGLVPTRVSNHALEYKIQNEYGNIQDAEAFCYQDSGHHFYVLNFPSANATWVYDITTGLWHERGFWNTATGQYDRALPRCHGFVWDKHIVGDWRNGQLYQQRLDFLNDNGNPIRRLRSAPHISDKTLWTRYNQMLLDMAVGTAPQGENPQMMMRWSDNGGQTWTNEKWASAGPPGTYTTRVIWRRLSRSRDRVFEITSTDELMHVWVNAFINADSGNGV